MSRDWSSVADLLPSGATTGEHSKGLPRHRWFAVKESFSPQLVDVAIEHELGSDRGLVIDPFCGGGTVPVAAAMDGLDGVGIEVNPFLAFVADVKLSRASSDGIRAMLPEVLEGIRRGAASPLEDYSTFTRARGREQAGLFNVEVLRAFEGGWRGTFNGSIEVAKVLRLGLIRAASWNSNATRDGKALRYRQTRLDAKFSEKTFEESFSDVMEEMLSDLTVGSDLSGTGRIYRGDCRQRLSGLSREQFDLCVTSPPYLNSFDYTDVYRPELFLGKFLGSSEELRRLRYRTLRSHVQANWQKPRSEDFGELFRESWTAISGQSESLWDKRIPLMLQAYFEDMRTVLEKLRELAKPNACIWLVVSTSAYAGVEVPVDHILGQVGAQVGWRLREIVVIRSLRSSGQHWSVVGSSVASSPGLPPLRESLVILDAARRPR